MIQTWSKAPGKAVTRRRVAGFSLVETLVALLVLSVGLLGVAGLQLTGLRSNSSSASRSQATYLAQEIMDRMRANCRERVNYLADYGAAPQPGGLAELDLETWKQHLADSLPAGDGKIELEDAPGAAANDDSVVVITVRWDDSRGVDDPLEFISESRICWR